MTEKRTALVTGANKGIGFETARGLGALGWTIGVGARDDQRRREAVARLQDEGVDAFEVPLDVTDTESVMHAAEIVERQGGGLDVLVNNAGIVGDLDQMPTSVDLDVLTGVLDTNVLGVIRVTNAMLPMLRRSPAPRIVNVSSSAGSLARQRDPRENTGPIAVAYSPSKTLLNAVTVQYARELEGSGILINAVCPGFVATDLNGHRGTKTPQEGAVSSIRAATLPDDGPTGTFFDVDGVVPW